MTVGRGVLLVLILAGLWLPEADDYRDGRVFILVDRSDSVDTATAVDTRNRLAGDLRALDDQSTLLTLDYGAAEDARTIADAIRESLWTLEPGERGGIIVVSDGYWPADVAGLLEQASGAGVPVYWQPLATSAARPRILGMDAPDRARAAEQILVSVRTVLPEPGEYTLVLSANGEPADRQRLTSTAAVANLRVTVPGTGAVQLDAELIDARTGEVADRLLAGGLVNVAATPNILVIASNRSPLGDSLAAGGWPVMQITPREFGLLAGVASTYSALVLDDVAVSDMPPDAWAAIAESVQRDALGLMVLGGPNSFGLGEYHESLLEELLPVVAEPPSDESPASVIFLVDISGSMGRQFGTTGHLRAARDAVLHTAASLGPQDRVGLIAFDVEAQQLLPPAARENHVGAIGEVWPGQANGGTSIIPALDLALAALARDTAEQKILFLVSDGMLSPEDVTALQGRLAAGDADFTAMILSDGASDAPLERLELGNRGSILLVDDVLRLPVLMRDELENLRPAVEVRQTSPLILSPPPMKVLPAAWPDVDAFAVTRARADATVFLATPDSVPLLAARVAGSGRVLALTAGLNQWARDWLAWDRWPEFVAGLVNYIAVTNPASVQLTTGEQASSQRWLEVDTGAGSPASSALDARLVPPTGAVRPLSLAPDAPGRFGASVTADQIGRYTLVWTTGAGLQRHVFVRSPEREIVPAGPPVAQELVERGALLLWDKASADGLTRRTSARELLTILALTWLLLIIAVERLPMSSLKSSLASLLSRHRG